MKLALPSQAASPSHRLLYQPPTSNRRRDAFWRLVFEAFVTQSSEFTMSTHAAANTFDHLPCVADAFRPPSVRLPYSRRRLQAGPGAPPERSRRERRGRKRHSWKGAAAAIVVVSCNDLAVRGLDANNEASSDRPRKSRFEFSVDSSASCFRKDASSERPLGSGSAKTGTQQLETRRTLTARWAALETQAETCPRSQNAR